MRRRSRSSNRQATLSARRRFLPSHGRPLLLLLSTSGCLVLLVSLSPRLLCCTPLSPFLVASAAVISGNDAVSPRRTHGRSKPPSRVFRGGCLGTNDGDGGYGALITSAGTHRRSSENPSTTTTTTTPNPMAAADGTTPADAPTSRFRFHSPFLPPLSAENDSAGETTTAASALVILNSPVRTPPSPVFRRLWDAARYRVCADGGANRLYRATRTGDGSGRRRYVPDAVRGDLDSLLPAVSSCYEKEGTDVRRVADQNSTDLDKALDAVRDWISSGGSGGGGGEPGGTNVYVYGAFGGRFDHEMSALQALFKWGRSFGHRLFLYDDGNCAFLLPPDTEVEIRLRLPPPPSEAASEEAVGEGPTCGLVPIGGRCDVVRTAGLKWDLDGGTPLEFGGLVSTSNRVVGEVVTVRTSHPLLFTAEVRCPVSSSTTGL